MDTINQKEYLKKYLGIGKMPGEKKKKKKVKGVSDRVKIIDDDAETNISSIVIEDDLQANEDAPQIVAIIDERPPSLRVDDKTKNPLWQPIGSVDTVKVSEQKQTIGAFKIAAKSNDKQLMAHLADRPPPKKKNENSVSKTPKHDNSSPARKKNYDGSPGRQKNTSSSSSPKRSRKDDLSPAWIRADDSSSPSKYRNDDASPPRKGGTDDISPPRNRATDDFSPPRKRRTDDISPPRKRRTDDISPPRKRRTDDVSPPRRRENDDISPPRKRGADDISPPRRRKNEDISPPRKTKSSNDVSPLRKPKTGDISPPRKPRSDDISPPRRKSQKDDNFSPRKPKGHDISPSRRRRRSNDHSPPRKTKFSRKSPDTSPPRKHGRDRTDDKRKRESSVEKRSKKMDKTLDGKAAGLQDAQQLVEETKQFRQREDQLFKNLSKEQTGENAETVFRDRKSGKRRNLEEEEERQKKKREEEEKNKEKYSRWGRGLVQIENRDQQIQEELYEMSKPLARYADDEDLERYLKEQEREGDPMLQYIRNKKRKKAAAAGVVTKPEFEGNFMPNRFGIKPGHRWDGVDRSNGYEKKWFEVQNAKRAQQEDVYKWSTEDM